MARENTRHLLSLLDDPQIRRVDNFKEHNDWVDAREAVKCVYDEAAYQRFEASIGSVSVSNRVRRRQDFKELAAALIVDSWQREHSAKNDQDRDELDAIVTDLNGALTRLQTYEFSLSAAGQRLAREVRDSSTIRYALPALVSNVRALRDHCARARDRIPKSKRGPKPLARPGVIRLLSFWRQETGGSAFTENRNGGFEKFEEFAAAVIEPLQKAGFNVRMPSFHEAREAWKAR